MIRQNLDRQWNFQFTSTSPSPTDKPGAAIVDLPHDFSILQKRDPLTPAGPSNGFFPGGIGIYEKNLFVPRTWEGKKMILEFEGVYRNATVRVNHQIAAQHPYGYTSFHCDLTPYLLYDRENTLQVHVNNSALQNTRWYSGSGIYRHVWLLTGESIHITPWGVSTAIRQASPDFSILSVKTEIENGSPFDTGILVRSMLLTADGRTASASETEQTVVAGEASEICQSLTVSPACLWSVESPYLYTLRSEVIKDGIVMDSTETPVGIRSISFSAQEGFKLNGVPMKLKGGCVHHDCGLLGSAAYDRAEERKVELLKANGFNAVRCAHNPPSPAFLDACDRLGMLVIDEAFDCWREGKNPNDYSNYFEDWWQRDLASMILRDRNHPGIILWSTGNEIIERGGRSEGYSYSRKLADFVRKLDDTRAVTNALCIFTPETKITEAVEIMVANGDAGDYFGEHTRKFVEPLDVVGYNYLPERYESEGAKYPGRILCGLESFAREAFVYWDAVERLPYVIGDFVWTAWDYLGEAGIGHVYYNGETGFCGDYPWHQAYCGDLDICGFKRPQSYYRDCVWGRSEAPFIAVFKPEYYGKKADISPWGWPDVVSSWTWPGFEGKPAAVEVYCSNSEVELFLNGRSLGRKAAGKANRYIALFDAVPYEPGELAAVGYEKGVEVSRSTLKTAGAPAALRLTADRNELNARFGDLSYITVEVIDPEGTVVSHAANSLCFTVCGAGSLLAVGSGDPISEEMYTGNQRKVFEGRAMAVIRANGEAGEITLTASTDGLPPSSITIRSIEPT